MKYNELTIKKNKSPKRVGRGISGGQGKTAGRGTKGQGARKSSLRAGFSGGQTPLHMQMPKLRGFKSKRVEKQEVYTGQLDLIKAATVDADSMFKAGLITDPFSNVKLIVKGDVTGKKTIKIQAASAGAVTAVEKAGGSVEIVERQARPASKRTEKAAR